MTDEELAIALNVPLAAVPLIPPAKRRAYEHLIAMGDALDKWMSGEGPAPEGVIVDPNRRRKRRRR